MGYIEGADRTQIAIMPNALDDYIEEDNYTRVIDIFVDKLDMGALGFQEEAAAEGRPGYDPRDMLKLYIYGYTNKIRSSRKLERECGRNIEVMWLMKKIVPDFRCISDFRKNNAKALKEVFRSFVKLCDKAELISKEFVAIDGTKIKAVNSKSNAYVRKNVEEDIEGTEKKIAEYMAIMDKNDANENDRGQITPEKAKGLIEYLESKKAKLQEVMEIFNKTGENVLSVTDPEARMMPTHGSFDVCYNVQTAVEGKNHIIVDYNVTDHSNDRTLLAEDVQSAKEALGVETIESVADKGYRNDEDVLKCLMRGDTPNVYTHDKQNCYSFEFDKTETEITPEMRSSRDPEDVRKCVSAGVLPDILAKDSITIETVECGLQRKYQDTRTGEIVPASESYESITLNREPPVQPGFTRDLETDKVTCPMGQTLFGIGSSRPNQPQFAQYERYAREFVCRNCQNKCTAGKFRTVTFRPGETLKHTDFFDKCASGKQVTRIRENLAPVFLTEGKKVILKFYPDYDKLRLRKQIVEHPYGTVKHWNDASYLLVKGKVKAAADLALSFLGYNLKRALNILGTPKLIEVIRA